RGRGGPGPAAVLEALRPLRRARHGPPRAGQRSQWLVLPGHRNGPGADRRRPRAARTPACGLAAAAADGPALPPHPGPGRTACGADAAARALVAAHLRAPPGTGPDRKLGIPAPGPASLDRRVARTIKAHRAAAACVARVSEAHPGSALAAEQGVGEWIGKPIRRLIAVGPVRRPRMRSSARSGGRGRGP